MSTRRLVRTDDIGKVYADEEGYLYRGPEFLSMYETLELASGGRRETGPGGSIVIGGKSGWMRFGENEFRTVKPDPNYAPGWVEEHIREPSKEVAEGIFDALGALVAPYVPWALLIGGAWVFGPAVLAAAPGLIKGRLK